MTKSCPSWGLWHWKQRLVVGLVVELPVGAEGRVLPLAVPDVVGVFRSPSLPLLHHRVGDQIALEEAAPPVLEGIALRVHLGLVLDQGEHGAVGQGLALLGRLDGRGRARVELPVLLDVVPIGDGVEHPVLVARPGTPPCRGRHRSARAQDHGPRGGGRTRVRPPSSLNGRFMGASLRWDGSLWCTPAEGQEPAPVRPGSRIPVRIRELVAGTGFC